jgi:hypothetical protein
LAFAEGAGRSQCGGMMTDSDPCSPNVELRQLASSPAELNGALHDFFIDPDRSSSDNDGPSVLMYDNFYDDPVPMREMALGRWDEGAYFRYSPPDPLIAGKDLAAARNHHRGTWHATAFVTYLGNPVLRPQIGWRFNPGWLRRRIEEILGEKIDKQSWEVGGDLWNGACHLIDSGWVNGTGSIHHHFKPRDLEGRGWSGLVYLSENLSRHSGTSLWRNKATRRCVNSYGPTFSSRTDHHDLVYLVEPKFNRLVLFRENVLHRTEAGAGTGRDSRLTQTFFFRARR